MKKIQFQERYWHSTPPIAGPTIVPIEENVRTIPIAFPFCSIGKNAVTIAGPIAAIMAAPTAWNALEPIRTGNDPGKSGRSPQNSDPTEKSRNPQRNTFRNPIPSETFPKIRMHPEMMSR